MLRSSLPATQPVISGDGKQWGLVERQAPAPPSCLPHLHTPESQRNTSTPSVQTRLDMGWSLRRRGSASTFLYPSLIITSRKGGHKTLDIHVHPVFKDKVAPVSLRAPQKPHEGWFFKFCLVSPMELESKGTGADSHWLN